MKHKTCLFLLLAVLLFSCGQTSTSLASSETPTSSMPSFSSSSISSVPEEQTIDGLIEDLSTITDKTYKAVAQMVTSINYLTDYDPLTITSFDDFDVTRYVNDGNGMIERIGNFYFEDDIEVSPYIMQRFHDNNYFYQIIDYENTNDGDQKTVLPYEANYEEANLNIGFTFNEILSLQNLKNFDGLENYSITFEGDLINGDGEYSYSYSITQYVQGTQTPARILRNAATFIVENNFVISSEIKTSDELYAGAVKANWQDVTVTSTYYQGDFPSYEGTLLNPDDYVSAS